MARKYLTPDKLSIVVVGDQKLLKDGLSKIAPVELRDLEGNLLPVPVASETGAKSGGASERQVARSRPKSASVECNEESTVAPSVGSLAPS